MPRLAVAFYHHLRLCKNRLGNLLVCIDRDGLNQGRFALGGDMHTVVELSPPC